MHMQTGLTNVLVHGTTEFFEITTAALLHLLHCCLEQYWAASGPHLDLRAVWTSTKASSTRATDNMAMLKADCSSLRVVA